MTVKKYTIKKYFRVLKYGQFKFILIDAEGKDVAKSLIHMFGESPHSCLMARKILFL